MLTLLWAVLGLLAMALLLALLVLATPVHLVLNAEVGQATRFRLRMRLLGGLTPWLRLVDTARPDRLPSGSRAPVRRKALKPRSRPENHPGRRWGVQNEKMWRLLQALPELLRREFRRIRIEQLLVEGDIGLGDPADTGQLFGYIMPLTHSLRLPRTRIRLRPDFNALRVEGQAEAVVHIVPLTLLLPAVLLGWRVFVARA